MKAIPSIITVFEHLKNLSTYYAEFFKKNGLEIESQKDDREEFFISTDYVDDINYICLPYYLRFKNNFGGYFCNLLIQEAGTVRICINANNWIRSSKFLKAISRPVPQCDEETLSLHIKGVQEILLTEKRPPLQIEEQQLIQDFFEKN